MKIIENNVIREMTEEEVAEYEARALYEEAHKYDGMTYSEVVVSFIRERYTIDDELAIHRQKDTKSDEWNTYNAYCEDCKARAREIVGFDEKDDTIEND